MEGGDPWAVGAVAGPLVGLLVWVVKWMGNTLDRAIRDSMQTHERVGERIEIAVGRQTSTLEAYIAEERLVHARILDRVESIAHEVENVREAQRRGHDRSAEG